MAILIKWHMCTELHNYYWWIKCWQFCPIIANHQSLLLTNISSYTVYLEVFEEQHLRGLVDLDISSKINILKNCQLRYHISFKISISSLYSALSADSINTLPSKLAPIRGYAIVFQRGCQWGVEMYYYQVPNFKWKWCS